MKTKHFLESKTFWSVVLTLAVTVAKVFTPPQWHHYLDTLQGLLVSGGLWFAKVEGNMLISFKKIS